MEFIDQIIRSDLDHKLDEYPAIYNFKRSRTL